jgi:glycosyltransferase involved in cell wall biosynthesis
MFLRRAVDSVCAQVYSNWELIITDDGSTDETPEVIKSLQQRLGPDRLKAQRTAGAGVCAARNNALARARGEFVVYIDDDNAMHPLWLKAVAWAFAQFPDRNVGYGGCIIDDVRRVHGRSAGELPAYYLESFDRSRIKQCNYIDIGQMAHRRTLAEAHFDENLAGMGDWDLILRLTRDEEPLVIPAIACFYSTAAEGRLSAQTGFYDEIERVQRKHRLLSADG